MDKPIKDIILPLNNAIKGIALDAEGVYADLVRYPGFTTDHAIRRLRGIAQNLRQQAKRVDEIIKEHK